MALDKKQVQNYTRRLYRFLSKGPSIEFIKMKSLRGEIHWPENGIVKIRLDPREEVVSTLIHEFLHHIHPVWSETDILKMEVSLMNALSPRQVKTIIRKLAESI